MSFMKKKFQVGDHVLLSGTRYGHYDGEVGRVSGAATAVKGRVTYPVDMGDGMVLTACEADMQRVKTIPRGKARRLREVGHA